MIELLQWDSMFFGFPVGKFAARDRDNLELSSALKAAAAQGIRLIYAQRDVQDTQFAENARLLGRRPITTRALFVRSVGAGDVSSSLIEAVGPDVSAGDQAALEELALESGQISRFKLDPRISDEKWSELYSTWLRKSLTGEMADAVLVHRDQGKPTGMITVRASGAGGSIGLFAVAECARGRGLGLGLLDGAVRWFAAKGCTTVSVATQGANKGASAAYRKAAFRLESLENVYHFWLDR